MCVTQNLFLLSKDTPDVSNICRYEAVKKFANFGRRFSALFKLSPKAFSKSNIQSNFDFLIHFYGCNT